MRPTLLSATLVFGALLTVGCQSKVAPTNPSVASAIAPQATAVPPTIPPAEGSPNPGNAIANSQPANPAPPTQLPPSDSTTYQNANWTVTVSNNSSWSGVNGTGDLNYRGCDTAGNCLELTGGTVTCRDGRCVTGWSNGNFSYVLIDQITETGSGSSQLVVREGDNVIVNETLQRS